MGTPLVLIGGGGHCVSCIEAIESSGGFSIAGIVDVKDKVGTTLLSYSYIGCDDDLKTIFITYKHALITIGQLKSALTRIRIYNNLLSLGFILPVVTAASALVSIHATVKSATIVLHRSVINSGALVMENCIINTGAIIEHDCVVGAHTHVSTGAIINGNCQIGSRCLIGSGSVLKQGIKIADDVIIGAGSTVLMDIKEAGVYVGNPVRKLYE